MSDETTFTPESSGQQAAQQPDTQSVQQPRRPGGHGAKPGNANRTKHGGRSNKRHGLLLTDLAARYPGIYHSVLRWRRELEDLVTQAHGAVSLGDAAIINLACRLEMTARITEYRVAKGDDPGLMRLCCQVTSQRNQCLERLGIDHGKTGKVKASDPAAIYRPDPSESLRPASVACDASGRDAEEDCGPEDYEPGGDAAGDVLGDQEPDAGTG